MQSTQSADDRRVRTITLTKSGPSAHRTSKAHSVAWIEAAVADACGRSLPHPYSPRFVCAPEEALAGDAVGIRAERLRPGEGSHASA